jgi:D-2-hydroxyacid dehydrogenase (NADP+)
MKHTVSRRGFLTGITTGTAAALPGVISSTTALAATPVVVTPFPLSPPRPDSDTPVKIMVAARLTPQEIERIRAVARNSEVYVPKDQNDMLQWAPQAEVIVGTVPAQVMERAKNCKWVQTWAAGLEELPEVYFQHPAVLCNMQRVFTPVIAEHAFGMLLGLTRGFIQDYVPNMRTKQWIRSPKAVLDDLYHKTVGIVGLGGMGDEIARRAYYGFSMKVLATDAKPLPQPEYVQELREPRWFMEMVPQVDVLFSAVPHTKITEGMFNEEVFRSMKRTAYFINTSRGAVVNQAHIIRALQEGWIRGAGLDVVHPEPLPPSDPLWDAPNLLITCHTSGHAAIRQVRLMALVTDNVRRYTNGLPLRNVCDKQARY